jgi:cell division initiation protein
MKIAPIDIAHKTFSRKLGGIDGVEVEEYLKNIADEMETLIHERNQLKEQIRERDMQMLEYRERDKALKETIMTAHRMTETLRKDADREAAIILNDAQQRAEAIVRDARDGLKRTYQEITDMKRQRSQFEVALRSLVSSHLELLERSAGYLPHISGDDASKGGNTPNMRNGKPILEA